MKYLFKLSILLFLPFLGIAQDKVDYNRTKVDGNRNQVDARLRISHSLSIPRASAWTLNSAKDSSGYIMFNTSLGKFGVYQGSGVWKEYATLEELTFEIDIVQDSIGDLRADLNNKVDKVSGKQLSTEDYTTTEKSKLAGIASGATANSTDATLLARANHTGTQAISTVSGLQTALDSKLSSESDPVFIAQRGVADGVATLNSSGKIPNNQIPALALVDTYVAASQSAMLALSSAEQGDVVIRTDLSKTFILTDNNYSTLSSWSEMLSPVIPAETDPIWGASPSAGISSGNIANWNTAYGWGNPSGVYLPLSGGTLTGGLNGTALSLSGLLTSTVTNNAVLTASAATTNPKYIYVANTSGGILTGTEGSAGNFLIVGNPAYYGAIVGNAGLGFSANNGGTLHYSISSAGSHDFKSGTVRFGGSSTFENSVLIDPGAATAQLKINAQSNTYQSTIYFAMGGVNKWEMGRLSTSENFYIYNDVSGEFVMEVPIGGNSVIFADLAGSGDRLTYNTASGQFGNVTVGSGLSLSGGVLSATGGTSGTVSGSGIAGFIGKWSGTSSMANSIVQDDGSTVTVGGAFTLSGLMTSSVTNNAVLTASAATTNPKYIYVANTSGGILTGTEGSAGSFLIAGNPAYYGAVVGNAGLGFSANNGTTLHLSMATNGNIVASGTVTAPTFVGAVTGNASTITGQANSATITAVTSATINTIALRDANSDISTRVYLMDPTVGDAAPTKMLGMKSGGEISTMSLAQAQSYLGLGSNAYTSTSYYPNSNPSGFISGINSGNVITALGFTPVNPSSLATVATSGAYSDLTGTPSLSGYQTTSNLSTSTTLGTSNTLYPSQNAVKVAIENAVIASTITGTYEPDITNDTNVSSSVARTAIYTVENNVVTVFGTVTISPTSSGFATSIRLSPPPGYETSVASIYDISGSGAGGTNITPARVYGGTANDDVVFFFKSADTGAQDFTYSYRYEIHL